MAIPGLMTRVPSNNQNAIHSNGTAAATAPAAMNSNNNGKKQHKNTSKKITISKKACNKQKKNETHRGKGKHTADTAEHTRKATKKKHTHAHIAPEHIAETNLTSAKKRAYTK